MRLECVSLHLCKDAFGYTVSKSPPAQPVFFAAHLAALSV
jgi:hypothetical protein